MQYFMRVLSLWGFGCFEDLEFRISGLPSLGAELSLSPSSDVIPTTNRCMSSPWALRAAVSLRYMVKPKIARAEVGMYSGDTTLNSSALSRQQAAGTHDALSTVMISSLPRVESPAAAPTGSLLRKPPAN